MSEPVEPTPEPVPELLHSRFEHIPQFYSDGFNLRGSPFSIFLELMNNAPDEPQTSVAIVRMSPQWAKIMAILFKRQLQLVESQTGHEIHIPETLLEGYDISLDRDWRQ